MCNTGIVLSSLVPSRCWHTCNAMRQVFWCAASCLYSPTASMNGAFWALRNFDLVFKRCFYVGRTISTILAEVGSEVEIFLTKPTRSWKKGNVIRATPGSQCVSVTWLKDVHSEGWPDFSKSAAEVKYFIGKEECQIRLARDCTRLRLAGADGALVDVAQADPTVFVCVVLCK